MAGRPDHWFVRLLRAIQPALNGLCMFWGLTPPADWTQADREEPAGEPEPEDAVAPLQPHPERLIPHVPPTPTEEALWRQLNG